MGSEDLFSREEILSGLSGKRAMRLLLLIESQTAYVLEQTRLTLRLLLTRGKAQESEYDFYQSLTLLTDRTLQMSIHDLEKESEHWGTLIPEHAQLRAVLAHLIGSRYTFAQKDVPGIRAALGLDNSTVQAAYHNLYDKPLSTIYAAETPPDTRAFWFRVPGILSQEMVEDMVTEMEWVTLPWGKTLFQQGDPGNSLYAVVSGRLRAIIKTDTGEEQLGGEMGRGSLLGEMAMLNEDNHRTATVVAIRDSELIRLTTEGLDRLVEKHPQLGLYVTRQLAIHMQQVVSGRHATSQLATIAIVPASQTVHVPDFARRLAEALKAYGSVGYLNAAGLDEQLGKGTTQLSESDAGYSELMWWLNSQEFGHRFLILEADTTLTRWTQRCLRMADRVLIVADADAPPGPGEIEQHLYSPDYKNVTIGRELVLLHPSGSTPEGTGSWLENRHLIRHHHICLDSPEDFGRLARFIAGKAIGLVLGGGGARGLAHIGVIKALEESNIPIDMVGGVSFGAIMSAFVGLGWDWHQIYKIFKKFSAHTGAYFKLTLPIVSLMDGRRLNRLLQTYYGQTQIEDMPRNFFCLSSNLTRSQLNIHDQGPLWRWVRASISIPSVFPPVSHEGDLLVDGGVINNLPADVMQQRLGGGQVLASNVSPHNELAGAFLYDDDISAWQIMWRQINPFAKTLEVPNILNIVTNTMILGSQGAMPNQMASADLLFDNPIEQYGLFDYESIDELVEIGYRTTLEQLETWA